MKVSPETLILEDIRQNCRLLEKSVVLMTQVMDDLPFIRGKLTKGYFIAKRENLILLWWGDKF